MSKKKNSKPLQLGSKNLTMKEILNLDEKSRNQYLDTLTSEEMARYMAELSVIRLNENVKRENHPN